MAVGQFCVEINTQAAAGRILDLETKIARAHATREESEDFAKGAAVWTRAELEQELMPSRPAELT